jgi:hypothetical protein
MKRFLRLLVVLLALSVATPPVGVAADQKGKTVHVKEYTKRDGTKVAAHDRKAPEHHATATKAEKPKKASTVSQPAAVARDERGRIQCSAAAQFRATDRLPERSARLRDRSHRPARLWRGRRALKYAVAVRRRGQGEG